MGPTGVCQRMNSIKTKRSFSDSLMKFPNWRKERKGLSYLETHLLSMTKIWDGHTTWLTELERISYHLALSIWLGPGRRLFDRLTVLNWKMGKDKAVTELKLKVVNITHTNMLIKARKMVKIDGCLLPPASLIMLYFRSELMMWLQLAHMTSASQNQARISIKL